MIISFTNSSPENEVTLKLCTKSNMLCMEFFWKLETVNWVKYSTNKCTRLHFNSKYSSKLAEKCKHRI